MKLCLARQAARDIDEIYLFGLIHFGEIQADNYASNLENCFNIIAANPFIGRVDARVKPPIRRLEFQSHVIFYDVSETNVIIVRILHKSMDFLKHL